MTNVNTGLTVLDVKRPAPKRRRYGKVPVMFYAPPKLVDDYRRLVAKEATSMSADLRTHMETRVEQEAA